ncbi:MAG TPA: Gfo/Idh/MocA family oxidoreductase [Syntrophomonadaceae bacterium]|nr:Gfo/Idh/MocA family oxidoreductase [Syntrophomonadaceae bacterium]
MNKKKVGIIGLGIGEKHVLAYQSHPSCEVVSLCDFNPDKFEMAKEKYVDIKVFMEADEILNDPEIDIISIASYDNYHCEQALKAIANNKHIMIEKPFCLYREEAIRIKDALKSKPNIKMSSNLVLRTTPRFRWLKDRISEGNMGQLYHVEGDYNYGRLHKLTQGWRGKIDFYSVVYGGGLHIIDLLRWLTGDEVVEVSAYGNNISSRGTNFRYNDMVVAILRFASGMTGKIAANFSCVQPHFHELSIYGTMATFKNRSEEGILIKSRDTDVPAVSIKEDYPGINQKEMIHSFVNSIITGDKPIVSEDDVFKSMAVCFAIERAATLSRSVEVEYM